MNVREEDEKHGAGRDSATGGRACSEAEEIGEEGRDRGQRKRENGRKRVRTNSGTRSGGSRKHKQGRGTKTSGRAMGPISNSRQASRQREGKKKESPKTKPDEQRLLLYPHDAPSPPQCALAPRGAARRPLAVHVAPNAEHTLGQQP
jgi:hypothetical protein